MMFSRLALLLVCPLVVSGVGNVDDQTSLLQTNQNVQPHRGEVGKVPEFEIDLDKAPHSRFDEVTKHFKAPYLAMIKEWGANDNAKKGAAKFEQFRGPETDSELDGEIKGIAAGTGIDENMIHSTQFGASMQSLKGPYFKYLNSMQIDLPSDEKMAETAADPAMAKMAKQFAGMTPQEVAQLSPSFGCTGVIARAADGSVYHARNFDSSFSPHMQKLTYHGKFTKGGKELYTGQMVYPYVAPVTAMRKGKNGYTYEMNSRYGDTSQDAQAVMVNMFQQKRPPAGWQARKILEQKDNYEDAVEAFSTAPYPSNEYNVISGVNKGTILARNPDGVDYQLDLGPTDRFIVQTNFDSTKNDKKEFIKARNPAGLTPRVRAQKLLSDKSKKITPKFLHSVMNDKKVMEPNTVYQALMNVQKGEYESNLPACTECSKAKNGDHNVNFLQMTMESEDRKFHQGI